jgi:hypothetical protein
MSVGVRLAIAGFRNPAPCSGERGARPPLGSRINRRIINKLRGFAGGRFHCIISASALRIDVLGMPNMPP